MKKLLIVGAAVAGVALLARRAAAHVREFDFAQMMERMPENSPPKWHPHGRAEPWRRESLRLVRLWGLSGALP